MVPPLGDENWARRGRFDFWSWAMIRTSARNLTVKTPKFNWFVAGTLLATAALTLSHLIAYPRQRNSIRPPAPRTELEDRAWQVLRNQLKGPSYSAQAPSWDTNDWFTKCDVKGLMDCGKGAQTFLLRIPPHVSKRAEKNSERQQLDYQFNAGDDIRNKLSKSLRIPNQLASSHAEKHERFSDANGEAESFESEPSNLASVLFNGAAFNSLKRAARSWGEGHLKAKIAPGSILAKAIWERVPMNPQGTSSLGNADFYIYRPAGSCYSSNCTKTALDDGDFQDFALSTEVASDAEACAAGAPLQIRSDGLLEKSPDRPKISPFCFHAYLLTADKARIHEAHLDRLSAPLLEKCNGRPCYFVLVGIHFMVRLSPDDPLYRDYAPWLFMTFWWTGRDNGKNFDAPWSYYQMNVTQVAREGPDVPITAPNICYNPYLEGPRPNGAISNCVSCHRFARVLPSKDDVSLIAEGSGKCFGSRPISFAGQCSPDGSSTPGEPCKTEREYDERGTDSNSVWSLANLNQGNPQAP